MAIVATVLLVFVAWLVGNAGIGQVLLDIIKFLEWVGSYSMLSNSRMGRG